MDVREEEWKQTERGIFVPRSHKLQQGPEQLAISDAKRDEKAWKTYWEGKGQEWRTEPEINASRQQILQSRLNSRSHSEEDDKEPVFSGVDLIRADIEWLIHNCSNKVTLDLRKVRCNKVIFDYLPLEGADFRGAQLEGANFVAAQLERADFRDAQLEGADFWAAHLEGADFESAHLEGANFWAAQLEGANFESAQLKGAIFISARLKEADFEFAQLEGANFVSAQLEGADFMSAQLEGAIFVSAQLEGANFGPTQLKGADFSKVKFADSRGIGPNFAGAIGWDSVFLANIEWTLVKKFHEEVIAREKRDKRGKVKPRNIRLEEYQICTRSYRHLATALEAQGLKEETEYFAYRAQLMQWHVLWWWIWQKQQSFWSRIRNINAFLFSCLLWLLTGYGYRFGRSLLSYLSILLVFALLYLHISQATSHPLGVVDAFVLSVSDMVGRGFFREDMTLSDPYAIWSVLEGMIGVFMDVLLISTFTQRLFKK